MTSCFDSNATNRAVADVSVCTSFLVWRSRARIAARTSRWIETTRSLLREASDLISDTENSAIIAPSRSRSEMIELSTKLSGIRSGANTAKNPSSFSTCSQLSLARSIARSKVAAVLKAFPGAFAISS